MLLNNVQRGIISVIGCILVCISVGEINLLGFIYPYFIAYFISCGNEANMSIITTLPIIWVLVQTFSNPFGIYMYTKLGFRGTYFLFMTSFCIAQFASSYITNIWLFIVFYAVSGGVC